MRTMCMSFAVLLVLPVSIDVSQALAARRPRAAVVSFEIPKDCPTGLPVLLHGQLVRGCLPSTVVQVWNGDWGIGPILSQYDPQSGEVLCFLPVDRPELPGQTIWCCATAACFNAAVTIEETDAGFQFYDRGRPVMFYQKKPHSLDGGAHVSANYVHPLLGLDGETLTEDFPRDHRHHHGVFWAWHQIWVGQKRAGDAWADKDFLPVVKKAEILEQGPLFATLHVTVHWTSPLVADKQGRPIPIVQEETSIRLFRAVEDFQYVDFAITLHALLDDVRIGGAENVKGYSGFTVRFRPPQGIAIVNDSGRLKQDAVGAKGRYVDVSGLFAGGKAVSGAAILCHPSLPEFPPRWLLRHYGPQNVIYPGRYAVPLPKNQPLTLHQRVLIHRGDARQARVADHQGLYELSPAMPRP
ncbi:MAG: hypothetical protein GXP27_22820 [Planctomycetes bacterium]|nr:hypothetical protein [Planctomycetota bacterium]